jgi:hypothetical protein
MNESDDTMPLDEACEALRQFTLSSDTKAALAACQVLDEIETAAKTQQSLQEVLKLAAYFQDDYTKKLPVIAAFRRWRSGAMTTDELLARLDEDDLAEALGYEKVPPMQGLTILNDHRQGQR